MTIGKRAWLERRTPFPDARRSSPACGVAKGMKCGVYTMRDAQGEVIQVGKAGNLRHSPEELESFTARVAARHHPP